MPAPSYELSAHAATVIAERDIEVAWLELAMTRPDRVEPHRFDPALKHAFVRIPDRGDRVLRVVYNPSRTPPKIVTAYFDRQQRGKP
jgi:hypothetical protein